MTWETLAGKPQLPSVGDTEALYRDADKVVVLEDSDIIVSLGPGDDNTLRLGAGDGGVRERRSLASNTAFFTAFPGLRWDVAASILTVWLPQALTAREVWFANHRFVIAQASRSPARIPWGPDATVYTQYQWAAVTGLTIDRENTPVNLVAADGNGLAGPRLGYATLPTTAVGQQVEDFAKLGNTDIIPRAKQGIVVLTDAQYTALTTKVAGTLYFTHGG